MLGMPRMDGSSAIPGNFASKLGGALGAWITGVLLSLAGYISAEGVTEQPAGALMMIRIDFAIVPVILVLIIGLCCLAFSKLEKQAAEFEAEKKAKETPLTELNCTPFVRQYGILFRKWGVFVCQRDNESTTERRR